MYIKHNIQYVYIYTWIIMNYSHCTELSLHMLVFRHHPRWFADEHHPRYSIVMVYLLTLAIQIFSKCRLNIPYIECLGTLPCQHPWSMWSCFSSKDLGTWPHRLCQLAGLMKQHHQDISEARNSKSFASQQKRPLALPLKSWNNRACNLQGLVSIIRCLLMIFCSFSKGLGLVLLLWKGQLSLWSWN